MPATSRPKTPVSRKIPHEDMIVIRETLQKCLRPTRTWLNLTKLIVEPGPIRGDSCDGGTKFIGGEEEAADAGDDAAAVDGGAFGGDLRIIQQTYICQFCFYSDATFHLATGLLPWEVTTWCSSLPRWLKPRFLPRKRSWHSS